MNCIRFGSHPGTGVAFLIHFQEEEEWTFPRRKCHFWPRTLLICVAEAFLLSPNVSQEVLMSKLWTGGCPLGSFEMDSTYAFIVTSASHPSSLRLRGHHEREKKKTCNIQKNLKDDIYYHLRHPHISWNWCPKHRLDMKYWFHIWALSGKTSNGCNTLFWVIILLVKFFLQIYSP